MQCSAWRPTSSASTSVRPPSSSTRWNSCGPSPGAHAGPQRRVRVHPLGGRGARQQLQEDLEVAPRRAAPSRSPSASPAPSAASGTCARCPRTRRRRSCPVSAIPKFAPETATGTDEELRAQVQPRGLGDRRRLVAQRLALGDRALEQRADLRAVAVDRRARGCATACRRGRAGRSARRGRSPARGCPRASSASLMPISSVASDLTLITSSVPVRARDRRDDRVRLGAVARPVHDAARRASTAASRRSSCSGSVAIVVRLDRLAGVAQRLPVGQLGDRALALVADQRRRLADVAAQLRVRPARPSRARLKAHSCAARISARCIVAHAGALRATARRRCASGTTCPPTCTPPRACRARAAPCRRASPSTCRRS